MTCEVKIVPIFNQNAPSVWDDFLHIRAAAVMHVYNYKTPKEDDESTKEAFKSQWGHKAFNFAFGAYNGSRMVGFIRGYGEQNVVNIEQLYLLPDYMSKGIGVRLLNAAESIASFYARDIELVSLLRAQDFYKRNGYKGLFENRYTKHINNITKCSTLPVFKSTPLITHSCKQIFPGFDAKDINVSHTPMFVYLNVDSKICGYVTGNDKEAISINVSKGCSDFVRKRLLKEIGSFYSR